MTDKNDLADEIYEDDGEKPRKPKDKHYSDKGSHGERHKHTHTKKELEKQNRRNNKEGKIPDDDDFGLGY